jgi:predicted acylesterase/phospholipase RssA
MWERTVNTQLRISLTLSGGASLGAYQAGVVAALLVAVQHLLDQDDDRVRIDAMGGASAGALVAFFAAHALADGIDPVALLRTAWVEEVSLDLLRSRGSRSPLDFEDMTSGLRDVLGVDGAEPRHPPTRPPQPTPVMVHVSLTGLQGLTYPIRARRREAEVTAVTYADWGRYILEPESGPDILFEPEGSSPIEMVLASAANPGGFAPRLLDRSDDAEGYRKRGITDLPDHGRLWYSDGGLVQTQPLGRVTAAARLLDAERDGDDREFRRVNVVIDPRSEGPSGSRQWVDPDTVPGWTDGLSRALAILPAQTLYDDLRRTEKRNTRLEWTDHLMEAVAPHLGEGAESALRGVLDRIDADRESLRSDEPRLRERERESDEPDPARRMLRRAVEEIAGLVGKEQVAVDLISPRLLTDETGEDVPELLAGEFLGDFGGFLREELRMSDFVLGYQTGLVWIRRAIAEADFDDETAGALLGELESRRPGDWREANRGRAGLRDLPWRARLGLARYILHVARVVGGSIIDNR